ncbi:hypothetical protein BTO15_17330 [Polaribacter sejongensis]|uniref:Uncharacterized protein n=1 Tax=Polaribacter sejongensis TaxID=985043 RepID=A0ABN5F804_9FLAO|nr:hypothetical protein [Polaribacter sejongensis]AUC23746.1 hypothetical protein BTO15_17330 [Polaribacter sejongensis]
MKFQLNPLASDIFISIYAVSTLYFRFKFEDNGNIDPILSVVLGLSFVTIIWALIKLKILKPNWFGLLNSKKARS